MSGDVHGYIVVSVQFVGDRSSTYRVPWPAHEHRNRPTEEQVSALLFLSNQETMSFTGCKFLDPDDKDMCSIRIPFASYLVSSWKYYPLDEFEAWREAAKKRARGVAL